MTAVLLLICFFLSMIALTSISFLWSKLNAVEKKVDRLEQDLERNFDLDSHQESSINYLRDKD